MDVEGGARSDDVTTLRLGGEAVLGGAGREVVGRAGCVMMDLMQQVRAGGRRHVAHAVRRKALQLGRRRAAVTDRAQERTAHF